jgi:hypothetical protein
MAGFLLIKPYSSQFNLASSILGNDKALWDEQGFALNWAGMISLATNCPSAHRKN